MFDEDLSVFFDDAEFARTFTLQRPGAVHVSFKAIFGTNDDEGLDGYVLTAEFTLQYATQSVALRKDDVLIDSGGQGYAQGTRWVVRETPQHVNDGAESRVRLSRSSV